MSLSPDLRARWDERVQTARAFTTTIAQIRASAAWTVLQFLRRLAGRPPAPLAPPAGDLDRVPASDAECRDALAALDRELTRVHHELWHVERSRVRRTFFAVRQARGQLGVAARHPAWMIGAVGRRLTDSGPLGLVRRAWRRYARQEASLRFVAMTPWAAQGSATDAVRWLGPVAISGRTWLALFCHPDASATWRVDTRGARRVETALALAPSVWAHNRGGVTFVVTLATTDGQVLATATRTVDPGVRFADRRWWPVTLAVPASAPETLRFSVETRVPAGVSAAHAWAIVGEPRLVAPTSSEARARTRRGLVQRWRLFGWRGVVRQLQAASAQDEAAQRYRQWVARHTPTSEQLAEMRAQALTHPAPPRFSILVPVYNTDPRWLTACVESVRAQAWPHWQLCLADDCSPKAETQAALAQWRDDPRIVVTRLARNGGIAAATEAARAQATGDWIVFLDHDDVLPPHALASVAAAITAHPEVDAIYSDEDKLDSMGERCEPYFKPDFSPEQLEATNYLCHLSVMRATLVAQVGGVRPGYDGAQDYDLWLRVADATDRIHHIPDILYHWRMLPESTASAQSAKTWASDAGERALQDRIARTGEDAVVVPGPSGGLYRVRRRLASQPLVSIIMPTDGRVREFNGTPKDLLRDCVRSVVERTTYDHFELVIMDNGTVSPEAAAYMASVTRVPVRRVRFEEPFNYSRKLNFGVRHAHGEQLMLFNDDLEVVTPDWIEAMLEHGLRPGIGGVGPKLVYPDGRLQHIGVVMGVCGMAAHVYHSHPGSSLGYFSSAVITRNYSALTAACMMTPRALYEQLGGFDPIFRFDFNDTDYCLRVRRAGLRLVFTPHAQLVHYEGATFGSRSWDSGDLAVMRERWAEVCNADPYYNPHLTREFPDCTVRGE